MSDQALTPNEAAALADLEFALTAPHTLEEIAAHLGISRFAAARIEKRALGKMRLTTTESWETGLREPRIARRCDDAYPSDGMTRPARRFGQ